MALPYVTTFNRSAANLDAIRESFATDALSHTELLWRLQTWQSDTTNREQVLAVVQGGDIQAVGLIGRQTLLSSGLTHRWLGAYAAERQLAFRCISGPCEAVAAFNSGYEDNGKQHHPLFDGTVFLMRLDASPLPDKNQALTMRRAALPDVPLVEKSCLDMFTARFGQTPRNITSFSQSITRNIAEGRWWFIQDDSLRLLFRTSFAQSLSITIDHLWAPPESRGQGYATRALKIAARYFLQRHQTLLLTVDEHNARARSLYHRLDFRIHAAQRFVIR